MSNQQVLVLNADYTPQRPRPLRDALRLLAKGSAEVLETRNGMFVHSGEGQYEFPSVIRIKQYHNVPVRGATWHAKAVLQRDNYTCIFCGRKLSSQEATIDHIYPKSRCKREGIPYNTWVNTACACRACQTRKGDKTLSQCGMKLLWEPRTPRTNYIVFTSDIDPSWKHYLEMGKRK